MLISTKYAIGESIWFLAHCELQCNHIVGVDTFSDSDGVSVAYRTTIKGPDGTDLSVCVSEKNTFSSKDELINTITDNFYKTIAVGES